MRLHMKLWHKCNSSFALTFFNGLSGSQFSNKEVKCYNSVPHCRPMSTDSKDIFALLVTSPQGQSRFTWLPGTYLTFRCLGNFSSKQDLQDCFQFTPKMPFSGWLFFKAIVPNCKCVCVCVRGRTLSEDGGFQAFK